MTNWTKEEKSSVLTVEHDYTEEEIKRASTLERKPKHKLSISYNKDFT
jgi:hypothetical protein